MWTFGISEVTTWPWSYGQDLARYAALGARAIEVWEFKLDTDAGARREQLARAHAGAVWTASSFQADVHSLFPTRDAARAGRARRALRRVPEHPRLRRRRSSPARCSCLNTGIAQDGDVHRASPRPSTHTADLARRAAAAGVRLALRTAASAGHERGYVRVEPGGRARHRRGGGARRARHLRRQLESRRPARPASARWPRAATASSSRKCPTIAGRARFSTGSPWVTARSTSRRSSPACATPALQRPDRARDLLQGRAGLAVRR